jgi:hypothetical protein
MGSFAADLRIPSLASVADAPELKAERGLSL